MFNCQSFVTCVLYLAKQEQGRGPVSGVGSWALAFPKRSQAGLFRYFVKALLRYFEGGTWKKGTLPSVGGQSVF